MEMALSIPKVARNVSPVQTRVGRGRKRWWSLERLTQLVFVLPAVVYLCLFFGYPLVKNLIMSFQNYTTSTFFTGDAPWVGFANYVTVFRDSLFKTTVINTVLFTVGSIAG